MPVQMIELEEVTMVKVSDESLESVANAAKGWSAGTGFCVNSPACVP
jgi:hypothetical protein